jgi:arabinosaccharide transport system permease protein
MAAQPPTAVSSRPAPGRPRLGRDQRSGRATAGRRGLSPAAGTWIQAGFLIVIAAIALVPLVAIFVGTFQDGNEVIRRGMTFDVDVSALGLDNYVLLFTDSGPYFRWFGNTLVLTIVQVVGTLLVSSFVAYGFAMYEFRGKTLWFIMVLLVMTVPFEMLMLPLYVQVNDMGLADTYTVIVLPFLASAVTIFFFRQYFLGIPKELIEAGRVDGVTEFGIFFRIVLPISKPAMAAMAILNGMICWNNFLWPLLVLRSPEKFTLPIGLNTLLTPYGNNYELLIIGAFFSLIPILILFLAFQRFFIEGMTAGAVKG